MYNVYWIDRNNVQHVEFCETIDIMEQIVNICEDLGERVVAVIRLK